MPNRLYPGNYFTKNRNASKKMRHELTLLISKRLLQHGEYDRVVQNEVAKVTGSRGTQSGVANQRVFIQQTAGRGGPTR